MRRSAVTQPAATPKINLPVSRGIEIARPRLTSLLSAHRVTALLAPPGSGKSTLAAQWARAFPGAVVWTTLEAEDDRPESLHFVLQMCDLIDPRFSQGPARALSLEGANAGDRFVSSFVEALTTLRVPLGVVVDEAQHLTHPALIHVLAGIAMRLPEPIRLVFVGRSLAPELRDVAVVVDDFSMSRDETEQYLAAAAGGRVEPSIVQRVQDQTEGWVMGVKLAGLALRQKPQSLDSLASFSNRTLIDLALSLLPPTRSNFLQQTCVCEWLTADLCAALTGDPTSARHLEDLTESGSFVTRFGGTPPTYRVHSLLRSALVERLRERDPDHVAKLRRLAAAWYGSHQKYVEAATQAIASGDIPLTSSYVLEAAKRYLLFEEMIRFSEWLLQFPAEVLDEQPRLRLFALMASVIVDKDLEAAQTHLACLVNSPQAGALTGEIALGRAYLAVLPESRNRDIWQPNLEQALATLPEDSLRATALLTAARLFELEGENERALHMHEAILELGQSLNHAESILFSLRSLAAHRLREGRYDDVLAMTAEAKAVIETSPDHRVPLADMIGRSLAYLNAQVLLQRGLVTAAETEIRLAVTRPNLAAPNLLQRIYCQFARILASREDWPGMEHFLREALLLQGVIEGRGLHHQGIIAYETIIEAYRAQCTLPTMDSEAARRWLSTNVALDNTYLIGLGLAHLTPFARLILDEAEAALEELEIVERQYAERQHQPLLWQVAGLRAAALLHLGEQDAADAILDETVCQTITAGDVSALALPPLVPLIQRRIIAYWDAGADAHAEHLRRVLNLLGEMAPSLPIRPFTRAERPIVELVASGYSVDAIAKALHLAPNTVRFNIRQIHRKMLTHSRATLVERLVRLVREDRFQPKTVLSGGTHRTAANEAPPGARI